MEESSSVSWIWLVIGLVSSGILFVVWKKIQAMGGRGPSIPSTNSSSSTRPSAPLRTEKRKSGLQSDILAEGTGPGAKTGNKLTVHYTAWLENGKKVDSSYDRGRTLTFELGAGKVIYGWDDALKGAKQGEKRKITVPSQLAYGAKGTDKIPPNATVIFEVELLKVE